jgi:hypothetical protein
MVRPFLFLNTHMWLPDCPPKTAIPRFTLFAAQAWKELLDSQTPDTFQARVLDLPTLLQEIADVSVLSRQDERWTAYLPTLTDELKDAQQSETTYLERDPRLRAAIEAIIANIDSERKTPAIVNERARIALTLFGPVEKRWMGHALELANGNIREKEQLRHRPSTLATHILARGLDEESLATISQDSWRAGPAEFIEKIIGCLSEKSRDFHCLVALNGERGDVASLIEKSRFSQAGKGRGIRHDPISRDWHESNDGLFFISAVTPAFSPRMAAEQCLQELSTLLNVQNLYHNSASFRAVARVLTYEGDQTPISVEVTPEKHFGLFPRSEYRKLSRDTYLLVGKRLDGRIANALECHALALSSDSLKTAMINLWTALETITGSMGTKATGERVAERIAPIIAYRRIDKIATYLALSVHTTVLRDGQGVDRNLPPNSNETFVAPDDILRAVTGKKCNDTIMYLFKRCSASPLLVNRLYTVWEEFHDPKTLAKSTSRSKSRVARQIARIYRARNLLVHRGEQSPHTWRLLRNAHHYVSSAISRVLHDLREQCDWSVDTSLVHQGQRYDYLRDQLVQRNGQGIMFGDLLLRKSRAADSLVWCEPQTPVQL